MKYKVILSFLAGGTPNSVDGSTAISFYTYSQALASCEAWIQLDQYQWAYLWDGSTWTVYKQVP
jgi:hypothetical protein